MRIVAQRVLAARVEVEGESVGSIDQGLLIYLAVGSKDDTAQATRAVDKILGLRIFADSDGRASLSVEDIGGSILLVSQFTLFGDVRKGRRPSFADAAQPEMARKLYEEVVSQLKSRGAKVETGRFRANMQVHSQVDGPYTILIDTHRAF